MENSIEIRITIPNQKLLNSIYSAIAVETKASEIIRGNVIVTASDMRLIITIQAEDLIAIRALSNSIMRLVKMSLDVATLV